MHTTECYYEFELNAFDDEKRSRRLNRRSIRYSLSPERRAERNLRYNKSDWILKQLDSISFRLGLLQKK